MSTTKIKNDENSIHLQTYKSLNRKTSQYVTYK